MHFLGSSYKAYLLLLSNLLFGLSFFFFTGCGDGTSSPMSPITGKAIDGYIRGATDLPLKLVSFPELEIDCISGHILSA